MARYSYGRRLSKRSKRSNSSNCAIHLKQAHIRNTRTKQIEAIIKHDHPYYRRPHKEEKIKISPISVNESCRSQLIDNTISEKITQNFYVKVLRKKKNLDNFFINTKLESSAEEANLNDIESCTVKSENINHTSVFETNFHETKSELSICLLCAIKSTNLINKSISHFVEMIEGFSNINITTFNAPLKACYSCYEFLKKIDNFRNQIRSTSKLINTINNCKNFETTDELLILKPQASNNFKNFEANDELLILKPQASNTDKEIARSGSDIIRIANRQLATLTRKKNKPVILNSTIENINCQKNADDTEDDCIIPFNCIVCRKPYTNQNVKECDCNQTKDKESENEKFVCTFCGKKYSLFRSLLRHETVHGEKKHICNICGLKFHFRLYLRRHLKKHTGQKPFRCTFCNKRFSRSWNLCQHKRLHTNSFPYKCQLCPAAFRHNVTLKKHLVMSHVASECATIVRENKSCDKPNKLEINEEIIVKNEISEVLDAT